MGSLKRLFSRFRDRRQEDVSVPVDRRTPNLKEAKERLRRQHAEFQDYVRRLTGDGTERKQFVASNDRQQVVVFSTFREICEHRLIAGEHRLCRHPEHEAANTGIARCDEAICPALNAALKGAA